MIAIIPLYPLCIISVFYVVHYFVGNIRMYWILAVFMYGFVLWLLAFSVLMQFRVFCGFSGLPPRKIWRQVVFLHFVFVIPVMIEAPLLILERPYNGFWISLIELSILIPVFSFTVWCGIKQFDQFGIQGSTMRAFYLFLLLSAPGVVSTAFSFFIFFATAV